jgi:LmbE family N-acetylglucosaminyl deacetylase
MKLLNFNKVLCLSPHPDDVEYAIAGTVMAHQDTHFDILNMTKGGDFDITTFNDNRLKEVENFWANVPNVKVYFTDAVHMKSKQEDEWVNYVETNFNIDSYDAVISPNQLDSHFEHRQTSRIVVAICRVAKVGIVEYSSPSTLVDWIPNYFIDISKQYNTKLEMLNNFVSQGKRSYFQKNQIQGYHTNFQASKRGLEIVEMFKIIQMYG